MVGAYRNNLMTVALVIGQIDAVYTAYKFQSSSKVQDDVNSL